MKNKNTVGNWRKTKRGLVTNLYNKMSERHKVDFSIEWLHEFSNCKKFNRLFLEWEKSGYKKEFKPSIDRISNKKHYTKENVQWLSWGENRFKQIMERRSRNGKVFQLKDGCVVNVFNSQREAVLKTGLNQGLISQCLNGKRNKTGGFEWSYENPESLIKD